MDAAMILNKIQKIWTLSVICLVVGLVTSTAFALDPMGPPVAGLAEGQMKVGFDYSHSTMDLELNNGTYTEFIDGVFWSTGELDSFILKDFEASRAYANLGYGFTDYFEGFVRVGGTKGTFGDSIEGSAEEFNSGNELAVGGGIKATFFEQDGLKLGGLIQGSWSEYHGKLDSPNWFWPDFVEMDMLEVQIAFGARYTWEGRFSVYGGPFFHFISGDLDDTTGELVEVDFGEIGNRERAWEIDEDSVFGGYFGAQLELAENCSFNIEYQRTAAADAVGLSLMFRN